MIACPSASRKIPTAAAIADAVEVLPACGDPFADSR